MEKPAKRNIVEGINHMGAFYVAMPQIAKLIEADYDEAELDKAYDDAMNLPEFSDVAPLPENHDGYGIWWTNWTLKGHWLSLPFVLKNMKCCMAGISVALMRQLITK